MEFVSVFDEASRDHEAEARDLRLTAASVEAQQVWPFLALAQSREEFGHRLALREDRLSSIAARHGVSYDDVAGPLVRGFEAIHVTAENVVRCGDCPGNGTRSTGEACTSCGGFGYGTKAPGGSVSWSAHARDIGLSHKQQTPTHTGTKVAKGLECRRCNHSNGPHEQGAACTCGCTTFQPKVQASKVAGRDEWEHDCTECGKTTTSTRENQNCECGNKAENLYTTYKGKTSSRHTAMPWEWRSAPGDGMGRGQYHLADWSEECQANGSGQCDGFKGDSHDECGCPCHNDWNLPQTVSEVKDWHDEMHGLKPESEERAPYRPQAKTAAQHGPSYDRDSVKNLPLRGNITSPENYYDEGYEHGSTGETYKGYGGHDKAVAYGHGFRHGLADEKQFTAAKKHPDDTPAHCATCGGEITGVDTLDSRKQQWHHKGTQPKDGHIPKRASKTAAGNPGCLTGYGTSDPSNCACSSCLRHPDSQMSDADKNYHRQVNDLTSRNDPDSPEFNDFDPATHHQDMYGDGFKTHNVNGHTVHEFATTTQGYNHSQTSDRVKDGDVLSVPSEGVHGFMYQAWPVASTEAHGEFHSADMKGLLGDNPQYARAHEVAKSLAHIQPKDAAYNAHIARLHQALMDGQDPLQWIVEQNPPGGPQYALVPSHHDSEQKFVADGTTGGNPDALDQALDQAGTSAPPSEHHEKQGSRPF